MTREPAKPAVRYARRFLIALLLLVVIDPFVLRVLRRFETQRYEDTPYFRFENSDLFTLGPLVSYLREHPRSRMRRVAFFGNSVMFGFALPAQEAIPGKFEALEPGTRAYNIAVNGFDSGSSYLIAKAMIDSVDAMVVQFAGSFANPMLPELIPVDDADVRAFKLTPPSRFENALRRFVSRWHLYAYNDRLQAALFGTSTRQYLYLHKKDIVLRVLYPVLHRAPAPPVAGSWPDSKEPIRVLTPRAWLPLSARQMQELRSAQPLLCDFGELARAHRKRILLLRIDQHDNVRVEGEIATFNAAYAPFARLVIVKVPEPLKFDRQHLTPVGAQKLAVAVRTLETEEQPAR